MNTKTRDELIADLIAAVDAALKDCDEYYELAEALGIERDDEVDDRVAVICEKSVLVLRNRRRALAELDAPQAYRVQNPAYWESHERLV